MGSSLFNLGDGDATCIGYADSDDAAPSDFLGHYTQLTQVFSPDRFFIDGALGERGSRWDIPSRDAAGPLLEREGRWAEFLEAGLAPPEREAIRAAERTGRPVGSADFIKGLKASPGRPLARRKPGRKAPEASDADQGSLL